MQNYDTGLYGRTPILVKKISANHYLHEMKGLEMMCAKPYSSPSIGPQLMDKRTVFV